MSTSTHHYHVEEKKEGGKKESKNEKTLEREGKKKELKNEKILEREGGKKELKNEKILGREGVKKEGEKMEESLGVALFLPLFVQFCCEEKFVMNQTERWWEGFLPLAFHCNENESGETKTTNVDLPILC